MKNTMIPQEDVTKLKEVVEKVREYVNNHAELKPTFEGTNDRLQIIHTILYLELSRDLVKSAKGLEILLECSEEEFIKNITDDGRTLEEVERTLVMNVIMDSITE